MAQHIAFTPAIRNLGRRDLETRNTRESLEVTPADSLVLSGSRCVAAAGDVNAGNLLDRRVLGLQSSSPAYVTRTSGKIASRAPFHGIGMPDRSSRTVASAPDRQFARQQQLMTSLPRLRIVDTVPESKSSEEKDVDLWFKNMESNMLRALNVGEGKSQLALPAIVARRADLAEEFPNLDQNISYEEARDHLYQTSRIRDPEEIWEDPLQRIGIRDGKTLRSYRQRLRDLVYSLGRIHRQPDESSIRKLFMRGLSRDVQTYVLNKVVPISERTLNQAYIWAEGLVFSNDYVSRIAVKTLCG